MVEVVDQKRKSKAGAVKSADTNMKVPSFLQIMNVQFAGILQKTLNQFMLKESLR